MNVLTNPDIAGLIKGDIVRSIWKVGPGAFFWTLEREGELFSFSLFNSELRVFHYDAADTDISKAIGAQMGLTNAQEIPIFREFNAKVNNGVLGDLQKALEEYAQVRAQQLKLIKEQQEEIARAAAEEDKKVEEEDTN